MSHRVPTDIAGRSRKGRALLAGGAVLGLGAAATLAAWSDDVWVVSSFVTRPTSIEAQVPPNSQWRPMATSGTSGTLTFTLPAESTAGMLPGDSAYAPLRLKIASGGPNAQISMATTPKGPATSPASAYDQAFFSAIELTLYRISAGESCSASGVSQSNIIGGNGGIFDGASLPSGENENLILLEGLSVQEEICFKVTLPADVGPEVRGGNVKPTWILHANPVN